MNKYSIILPVLNGGEYVKDCVNSILSQTYTQFNLIVLDNASTDGTLEWIRSLKDERIIIYTSDTALSIEDNWARIVPIPKNEFITCIGHDDILMPTYLEEMDAFIQKYPEASLYQTDFNFINAKNEFIRASKKVNEIQLPADFLGAVLDMSIDINGTGFMTRAKDFDQTGGIPAYPNLLFADFTLWLELAKKSKKVTLNKTCFSYRLHQSMTTTSADEKFHRAFALFIDYIISLKRDDKFNKIINTKAQIILAFYCKSFSHRLLRTELKLRNNLKVTEWTEKCNAYADLLIDNNTFKPSKIFSVRLARFIDSTLLTRKLFLLFKKIYPKPIL